MAKNFEKLIFGGLHEKHAVQRGIWVPTQHSPWDQGPLPGGTGPCIYSRSRSYFTTVSQSVSQYVLVSSTLAVPQYSVKRCYYESQADFVEYQILLFTENGVCVTVSTVSPVTKL
jgi:hypothetical protein